ncbi:hypothetical protein [Halobellus marinus]|uniref:hypothetical protein n=1 Tax=Halobellus TaxID=1073986 RepID=UPI0028A7D018|nr:hypothetical protein [Halobellus sp. DFY28]
MDGKAAIDRLLSFAGLGPRDRSASSGGTTPYACQGCGATFEVQYHVCPECGGYSVEFRADEHDPDESVDDRRQPEGTEKPAG